MSRLALYEKEQSAQDEQKAAWFGFDYVAMQMLISFICSAAAFAIFIGAYIVLHFEELMTDIFDTDLVALAKQIGFYYVVFAAVLLGCTMIIYFVRFRRVERSRKGYYHALKRLNREYGRKDRYDA